MGLFQNATDNLKQKHKYEQTIAELQEKLRIAEKNNQDLRKKIAVLEKSATKTIHSDTSKQTIYDLHQIIENFKLELEALPHIDKRKMQGQYNIIFVIIDYLCIPLFEKFGMNDLAQEMKSVSKTLKQGSMIHLCGLVTHNNLNNTQPTNLVESIQKASQDLIKCDDEKQQVLNVLEPDLKNIEQFSFLVNHIRKKYDIHALDTTMNKDPDGIKKWLQMVIELGNLVSDFGYQNKGEAIYRGKLNCLSGKEPKKFRPYNPLQSTISSMKIYELLTSLSESYGIDLSKMNIYIDRFDVCEPFNTQTPQNILPGKERD